MPVVNTMRSAERGISLLPSAESFYNLAENN